MDFLSFSNLIYIITILASIALALTLILNGKTKSSRYFVILVALVAFWLICNFTVDNLSNAKVALFFIRAAIIGPLFIGPVFYNFTLNFANKKTLPLSLTIITLFPSVVAIPYVFTNLNVRSLTLTKNQNDFSFTPGVLYLYLGIIILIYTILGCKELYKRYITSDTLTRTQIRYIVLGFIVTSVNAIITTLILPLIGIIELSMLGIFGTIFFLAITTYSLLKHRLFGVRVAIGRTLYLIIIGSISYVSYYLVLFIDLTLFDSLFSLPVLFIGIFLSILFSYSLLSVNKTIERFITKSFIDPGLIYTNTIKKLRSNFNKELNIEKILSSLADNLTLVLKTEYIFILIIDAKLEKQKKELVHLVNYNANESYIYVLKSLIPYISLINTHIILNEVTDNSNFNKSLLKKIRCTAIFPLQITDSLNLYLILGPYDEGASDISLEGINFVNSVLDEARVALGRSLLYEEVQNFNKTLQQKIKQATSELEEKNIALQEALRKEKDMMDIMGHELRTPLTIAQNAILMAEMRDRAGKLTEDKLHEMFEQTKEGIDREIKILDTILSSTRLENNRVPLNIEPIDAKDVVNDTIEGNRKNAEKKGLKLFTNMPLENVLCLADRAATQQIIDNLVSNAIKYTQIGSIEVTLQVETNWVKFSVKDTGEGIPKEEIKNLGKKFHRINPHLDSDGNIAGRKIIRPGGTGIGLFVVFEMTKLMKGKVEIESEVGKGSQFTVYLPKVISRSKTKEKKGTVRTSSNIE